MTIRFVFITLSLNCACLSSFSVVQNWEWVESLFDIAIEPLELKAILLIGLGLLVWRLRGRLYSFTNRMRMLAHTTYQIAFRLITKYEMVTLITISCLIAQLLIHFVPGKSPKNTLSKPAPTVSQQQLGDLDQKIQEAAHRYLLRKILKLKERPEDQAMAILSGAHEKQLPQLSEFQFNLRQKILLELLKAEKLTGYQCDFREAYLLKMDFSRRLLKANDLEGVLQGADFSSAHLAGSKFKDTNLRDTNFSNAALMHTHFIDCDLTNANFEGANLQSAIFSGSRLQGARFHRTHLLQTFFTGSYLNGAYADSPDWIADYHRLNSYSRAFSIRWHSIVEEKDDQRNSVYVFQGDDPPVKARKP